MSTSQKPVTLAELYALSGAAAIISKTAAAPIERVKLMVQNQDEMLKTGRLSEPYKGVIDCTVRTFRKEGILSFWRGNLPSCIQHFATLCLNHAFKEQFRTVFRGGKQDGYALSFVKNLGSAGIASALTMCCVYSLDYSRTRLANDVKKNGSRQFNGLVDVYKKTLTSDGFTGLHRGFTIACVGIIVYRACYFGLYDTLKPLLLGDNASFYQYYCLAYGVTISAGLISYPIDTVQRRMMMRSCETVKYNSSLECFMQIVRNEGVMSLMKGAGTSIVSGITGAAVLAGMDRVNGYHMEWRIGA